MKIPSFIKFTALSLSLCTVCIGALADGGLETSTTNVGVYVTKAKGYELRSQIETLQALVRTKKFDEAASKASEICRNYETLFDKSLAQYSFQSTDEFNEFSKTSAVKFEWIDWGYKECLQMQAFVASEKKDFANALRLAKKVESVAPTSAAPAGEIGYIFNQVGRREDAMLAYQRSFDLTQKYKSQRPYAPVALRGLGVTLIDLGRLDEAEKTLKESLQIDPGNTIAVHELEYIRQRRAAK